MPKIQDMTPEEHIAEGDNLLGFTYGGSRFDEHGVQRRNHYATQAGAHYAAATAKLALVTFDHGPKPVEMVFDRPVDTRPTA